MSKQNKNDKPKDKPKEDVQPELPLQVECPAEQAVESNDMSKIPSRFHKFSKGEK